jgi:hypothetical protein
MQGRSYEMDALGTEYLDVLAEHLRGLRTKCQRIKRGFRTLAGRAPRLHASELYKRAKNAPCAEPRNRKELQSLILPWKGRKNLRKKLGLNESDYAGFIYMPHR